MDPYKAVLSPTARWTRLLVSHGPDELLRAIWPPPAQVRRARTASTLLEGLSLSRGTQLDVVLSVDAPWAGFCPGPTSELGAGDRSMFRRVEAAGRGRRRRRGPRIPGVGDLADLRQLRSDRDPRSTIPC
jgi:hypothetical protein